MPVPTYISSEEYARRSGMSSTKVKEMCKKGKLDYYLTDGGYYKIKVDSDSVSKEKYLEVVKENAKLKTLLGTIAKTASQAD